MLPPSPSATDGCLQFFSLLAPGASRMSQIAARKVIGPMWKSRRDMAVSRCHSSGRGVS